MGESTYDEGVVVFDIDGTLADCEHRRHHVAGDKKNFDRFFDEMGEDAPKEVIVRLCNGLTTLGWQVHIMTGRPEKYRRVTESWLLHHHIRYETLHMRPDSRLMTKTRMSSLTWPMGSIGRFGSLWMTGSRLWICGGKGGLPACSVMQATFKLIGEIYGKSTS